MDAAVAGARFPAFRRHLRVVNGRENVYLFSERGVIALRGPHVASLAPLLDGQRDLATLLRSSPGGLEPEQVRNLIDQLVAADLVALRARPEASTDERAAAYWDACGVAGVAVRDDEPAQVDVVVVGQQVDPMAVRSALEQAGITVAVHIDPTAAQVLAGELTVVLCEDYLHPCLAHVDATHRATGRPWLLAKPTGVQTWIGPVFQPGETGCWHCLAHRLWRHRHAEVCVLSALGHTGPAPRPASSVPPLTAAMSHLIALEVTKWLAGHRHDGQRGVWTLDTPDLRGQSHEVRRRPQCPACGEPALVTRRARQPVVLDAARKASSGGGGHRTMTPRQVLDGYRHLVSPVAGIIKEITPDPSAPPFVSAYHSGRNLARRMTGMNALRAGFRETTGGKGVTPIDAEVGALCEAVERFSASYQGDECRLLGSLASFGDHAIHPNSCLLYDERQYGTRAAWNRAHSPVNHVCERFDENAVMEWTPLWSLTAGRHRLLPTAMLYFGAPPNRYVVADSNGNAAGSSLEDAILQGALEVVERDAVAQWWYNRITVPGVDLAAFGDPWIDELRQHYADLDREFWVLDATSDLGIPVFVAVTRGVGGSAERISFGFGAHLDPRTAVRRALTEMNQLLPALLDGASGFADPDAKAWFTTATVATEPYVAPDPAMPSRGPADFRYVRRDDVREDVEGVVNTLAGKGIETLVLDQTRPDVGLPVVKVVAPGMRPLWARFGPGRLYDVPVRLGTRRRPVAYHELNPLPMFL
ncbi:TOMM precursor leader peptide-binding protein [Actinomycetes bacterium KLBMP 9797]